MSNLNKILGLTLLSFLSSTNVYAIELPTKTTPAMTKASRNQVNKTPPVSKNISMTKIDLNRASAKEISKFKGFGPKRSQAIIEYRNRHGAFKQFTDLSLLRGISKRFIEKNLDKLKETFLI